jgi:hypothetical protein
MMANSTETALSLVKRLKSIENQIVKLSREREEKETQLEALQSGCRHEYSDPKQMKGQPHRITATCNLCGKVSERVISFG